MVPEEGTFFYCLTHSLPNSHEETGSTVTENTNKLKKHLEIYLSDIHSQLLRGSLEVEFQFLSFKADFMEGTTKFSFQRLACGDRHSARP